MDRGPAGARRLWKLLEPIHAVVYFAPEPLTALKEAGYRGFWMGYFAGRAAPLGRASAELAYALFYNFSFDRVARALPAAWSFAPPDTAIHARTAGSVAALRRQLGPLADDTTVRTAADLAASAAAAAPLGGRTLYAANRALPTPDEPLGRLWHAATLLREHRGDGHVTALVTAGITGRAAHVLHSAATGIPKAVYAVARDFGEDEWSAEIDSLRSRGYLDADGSLSADGAAVKARIEEHTDTLAATAYEELSELELSQLHDALRPITRAVVNAGDIPMQSPMGLDLHEAVG